MDQVPPTINLNSSKRYYCHTCRTEVRVTVSFTCMRCSGGFVEEITSADIPPLLRLLRRRDENNVNNNNNNNNNNVISESEASFASTSSVADSIANDNAAGSSTVPGTEGLISASGRTDNFRGAIMNVLMDVLDLLGSINNNANVESSPTAAQDTPNTSRRGIFSDNFRSRLRNMVAARHLPAVSGDPNNQNALSTFFDFAFGSTSGGLNANVNFGSQTFIMGNPNDSSRHDDDLTNLLMNSLNRLLPILSLPLSNDKLQRIPKVEVTAEDLANQDMCAICWDEFQLKEPVRKLPCSHFFHETCVFPWLKLHRTCPLCRDCLNDDIGGGGYNMEEYFSGESSEITENSSNDLTSSDEGANPEVSNTTENSSKPENVN